MRAIYSFLLSSLKSITQHFDVYDILSDSIIFNEESYCIFELQKVKVL